jgi:UrcA family protein
MKSTLVKRNALIGLAALTAALTVGLASATTVDDEPRTLVVRYSDLDLSQPRDAHRLYARIKTAARSVCDNSPDSDLARLAQYEKCVAHAVTNAVETINAAQLTEIRENDTKLASRDGASRN